MTTYRYQFSQDVPFGAVRDSMLLAVMAAEGLHGLSSIQLDASFRVRRKDRSCEVDASTPVGRTIARIFTGFLLKEFQHHAFRVERVAEEERPAGAVAGASA